MLITFFDVRGIVHRARQVYKEILQRVHHSVRGKRRELWQDELWLLHHDNAPVHNAQSIQQFLTDRNIAVLEQLPNSSDLVPWDFFSFLQVRGTYLQGIKRAITKELKSIPEESFQQCMEASLRRMEKCIILDWGLFWRGNNVVCCLELK